MEIYPARQLAMLLSAFSLGFSMGGVWELIAAGRILFGVYLPPAWMRAVYARPLPLVRRCVPWPSATARRGRRALVIALGDCLFCLVFALGTVLLLYYYNDGAIRPLALILAFVGLFAWRVTLSRILPRLTAWLAYSIAVLRIYIWALFCLPVRIAVTLVRLCVLHPVRALWRRFRLRRLGRISAALCRRQLQAACEGLCPPQDEKMKEREDPNATKTKKDPAGVGDPHPRRARVRRRAGDLGQSAHGVE